VALECARPLAGSIRVRLDGAAEVRIGRATGRRVASSGAGRDRVIEISLPDARLSSDHARLVVDALGWRLEDRGSKNGTFLNGEPVVPGARLADGDVCRCGQTLLLFRQDWPTDPASPHVLESVAGPSALTTLVPTIARRFDDVAPVAVTDVPVLLLGETGTGKEVTAGAIHALSRRRGELVTVNCGALPRPLVESVLFGHKRGAFSGAVADQLGLFRAAEGGTIVLDEVADLPLEVQVALLRVLQEREVLPVGASRPVKVDARILAATNADLEALVRAGRFREDLFARLAGFTLRLPPLRERREDLGLLVGALLARIAPSRPLTFTSAAGDALFAYTWPRNIRELEKTLARACALAKGGEVDVAHLELPEPPGAASPAPSPERPERGDDERRARLVEALRAHKGNIVWVAKALKTSRSQVHRWLKRFNLSPEDFRS
jgi:transcriptional regulator with GAF, ATPase, and Fis domain